MQAFQLFVVVNATTKILNFKNIIGSVILNISWPSFEFSDIS